MKRINNIANLFHILKAFLQKNMTATSVYLKFSNKKKNKNKKKPNSKTLDELRTGQKLMKWNYKNDEKIILQKYNKERQTDRLIN